MKYQLVFSFTNNNIYSDIITIENNEVIFRDTTILYLGRDDDLVKRLLDYFLYKEWDKRCFVSVYEEDCTYPTLINMEKVYSVELIEL